MCGTNYKQLERAFLAAVGVTPKFYSRIVRFRSVLGRVQCATAIEWGDIAYACGYAD